MKTNDGDKVILPPSFFYCKTFITTNLKADTYDRASKNGRHCRKKSGAALRHSHCAHTCTTAIQNGNP